jgi:hypothetical protein
MKYHREKSVGNLEGYMSIARDKKDNLWIVTYSDESFDMMEKP